MKTYIYSGAHFTVVNLSNEDQLVLNPSTTHDLPEEHPQVQGLIGFGLLTEVVAEVKKKEGKPAEDNK